MGGRGGELHIWDAGFEDQPGNANPRPCLACLMMYLNADGLRSRDLKVELRKHMDDVAAGGTLISFRRFRSGAFGGASGRTIYLSAECPPSEVDSVLAHEAVHVAIDEILFPSMAGKYLRAAQELWDRFDLGATPPIAIRGRGAKGGSSRRVRF